jgi:hypothetical protein
LKICLIQSLPNNFKTKTIESIKKEIEISKKNFKIYKEISRREETLNSILNDNIKSNDDIFIIADDIILTKGWKKKIDLYKKKFDVFSFQTLYPNSNIIQDYGYDLVNQNNKIILKPKNRYKKFVSSKSSKSRNCEGLCGCLLYITNKSKKSSINFSHDGMNRWSEFIYLLQLKNKGYKIGVINHPVYHNPISTKQKVNKSLTSISYNLEKIYWNKIIKKYDLKKYAKKNTRIVLGKNLKTFLDNHNELILYGAGTVSEIILKYKNNNKNKNIVLTSGLDEEIGKKIFNKKIYSSKELEKLDISNIIITAIGYETEILKQNTFKNKKILFLKVDKLRNNFEEIRVKKKHENN